MDKNQIRILHVFASLDLGGAETMVMNIYRNIDRSQIQFDFVKMTSKKCAYENEILSLGGKIYLSPRFKYTNLHEFNAWWNNFFDTHKEYKIIHGHYYTICGFYFRIAKKYGLITIGHSHTSKKRTLKYKIASIAAERFSDYCLACSSDAARFLFPHRDVRIIKNAIEIKRFTFSSSARARIRKELEIDDDCVVIGHTGRFVSPKNHFFLLDVFKIINEKLSNTRLLLIGDGPLRSEIEDTIRSNHLTDCCFLVGAKQNVADYLSAMDVFFFPSLFEGLGIALIEAQVSGLHCLASKGVPKSADVTGNCIFLELSEKKWVDAFAKMEKRHDENAWQSASNAGYDISLSAKMLETFYIKLQQKEIIND